MCAVGKAGQQSSARIWGSSVKYWWGMRRQALQEGLGSPASMCALLAVGQPPLWCWLGRTCSPSCRWGGRLATLSQETAQCVRVGGWPARHHVPWSTSTATQAPPCRSPRRPTPTLPEHVASVGLVAGDTREPSRESGGHGGGLRPWQRVSVAQASKCKRQTQGQVQKQGSVQCRSSRSKNMKAIRSNLSCAVTADHRCSRGATREIFMLISGALVGGAGELVWQCRASRRQKSPRALVGSVLLTKPARALPRALNPSLHCSLPNRRKAKNKEKESNVRK
jgi:hypothetical protein